MTITAISCIILLAMDLSTWRERCLAWQERDIEHALAHFTFIADVTTLVPHCRFVGDNDNLVARYNNLPFAALAFYGEDVDQIKALSAQLIESDEPFYCLVSDAQWPFVKSTYHVLEVHEEWQMLFRGNPSKLALDPGDAALLKPSDLPDMMALAHREEMMAFERDPLSRGPWYGVWRDGGLVAQGGVHLTLKRAVEIGNIVTDRAHRRRGHASKIIAALLHELHARDKVIFLQVFKTNVAAIICYEKLGFERKRTMYLAKCQVF